jgi:cell filamentation protein, protein adenylyltransferase
MSPRSTDQAAPERHTGRYVRQTTGYKAFIPGLLPPHPPLALGGLQGLLSEAQIALGRLDGSIQTLPHPDLFVFRYVRKEAVLSSQIEGTESSLQDVLEAEARILSRPYADVDEVVNYVAAMKLGLDLLDELPISVRLVRKIHERLLRGARGGKLSPGEVRTSQNWLGPKGCLLSEATFVPPPPQMVPDLLGNLEKYIHQERDQPLLIRAGLAHAQFETIHPFLDGNGRVGRLLITFLLCEQEVLSKPVLYLSHYFRSRQIEYYDRLQATRELGDWEGWIRFFLKGVIEVAAETARNILLLREQDRGKIMEAIGRGSANAFKVLEHLYRNPIVSVNEVQELTRVKYPTANEIVAKMVRAGILREITGQRRNRRFLYGEYIQLFS